MPPSTTSTADLEREWIQLRDRITGGCQLEHLGAEDPDRIHARVLVYFGESHDPAPVLELGKADVVQYLREQTRPLPRGGGEDLSWSAAVLSTNLDEEFDTDHGDERRLRAIGLRTTSGRVTLFVEVS